MTDLQPATRHEAPQVVKTTNIVLKIALLLLLTLALAYPESGNLQDKGAGARAIAYPLLSFTVPVIWYVFWRDRASFPWLADLLVTFTCFSDILGNRLDLYDLVSWFDSWMHFMNNGFLVAAVILLTMHRSTTWLAAVERGLAVGATGAIAWEIGEYFAFLANHSERRFAYADTLSDLFYGVVGSIVAALVIHAMWRRGRLQHAAPQLEAAAVLRANSYAAFLAEDPRPAESADQNVADPAVPPGPRQT